MWRPAANSIPWRHAEIRFSKQLDEFISAYAQKWCQIGLRFIRRCTRWVVDDGRALRIKLTEEQPRRIGLILGQHQGNQPYSDQRYDDNSVHEPDDHFVTHPHRH